MRTLSDFIVIEGIDGCGKGTQVDLLCDWLTKQGRQVWHTKEPTDGAIGRKIRSILRGELPYPGAKEFQELFVQDRAEHVAEILRHIQIGETVVCDRYFYTTLAYGVADGVGEDVLASWNAGFPRPQLMVWLELPPAQAMARLTQARKLEWFEKLTMLTTIHQRYLAMAEDGRAFPEIRRVDALGTVEEVQGRIQAIVAGVLTGRTA